MDPLAVGDSVRRWIRRHPRVAIASWLGGCALAIAALAGWVLSGTADRFVDAARDRWVSALDRAALLVERGDHRAARRQLQALRAAAPPHVVHRHGRQHERLLALLAESHLQLGAKRRCLETVAQLVAFDPRNWFNHFAQARARDRFDQPDAALEAYRAVLAIHPNHLPSVRAVIQHDFDAGRFAAVTRQWQAYLDAFLLAPITVRCDDAAATVRVPADAAPHRVRLPLDRPAGWAGELVIESGGYSLDVGDVVLRGAVRVGRAAPPAARSLSAPAWRLDQMTALDGGRFAARARGARLATAAAAPTGGIAEVELQVTAYKTATPELWSLVAKSYRNALDDAGLAHARARTRIGGCRQAGSEFEAPPIDLR